MRGGAGSFCRMRSIDRRAVCVLAGVICAAAARGAAAQGTPGAARPDSSASGVQLVAADVAFMQGMIAHHTQALAMVALIPSRTTRQDMELLGQRIAISQRDEIALMKNWLIDHHQTVPSLDTVGDLAGHSTMMPGMQMSGMLMPGMLTTQQMDALAQATGPAFERLFLEDMIQHHQGALVMVSNLFATPGAGQAPEIFRFASDVVADQRAEIKRMQAMLAAMAAPAAAGPS
jgi:uncharacterized protein (DUF305 family)